VRLTILGVAGGFRRRSLSPFAPELTAYSIMKSKLSLLTALLLVAGCSSTETLVYRHPAFDTTKSYRVAVFPFKDAPGAQGSGETLASLFEAALLPSGRFEVVERGEIDRVLQERQPDPTQHEPSPVGKLMAADPVIIGKASEIDRVLREEGRRPDASREFEDPVQIGKLLRADLVVMGKVTSWSRGHTSGLFDLLAAPTGTAVGASVRAVSVEKGIVVWSLDKSISASDELFIMTDAPADAVARTLCRRMVASLVSTAGQK
jgi:curli biogenesis system outer membrane secretion channel CsgG